MSRRRRAIAVAAGVLSGLAAGLGLYTFVYAQGGSYLTNDPRACANCHVMQEHYDAWTKSSHRAVATCNDCHVPAGFVPKYASKASNGFWHSFGFTTGRYPDPLQIKPHNREIVEFSCRKCHSEIVDAIEALLRADGGATQGKAHGTAEPLSCLHCHRTVGHPRR
jgi:cytochrome c nitrite reductase small subunit